MFAVSFCETFFKSGLSSKISTLILSIKPVFVYLFWKCAFRSNQFCASNLALFYFLFFPKIASWMQLQTIVPMCMFADPRFDSQANIYSAATFLWVFILPNIAYYLLWFWVRNLKLTKMVPPWYKKNCLPDAQNLS